MGYAFVIGNCHLCGQQFTFNPVSVPSIRDRNSVRQPICRPCISRINAIRHECGKPTVKYADDAYERCDERELV